ncbi:MAG: hypothetical protein ACKPEN_10050, partial [Planktothrix sp.]|uniref:hypothetical protein n=1 Tax=Planktothrix sp. TaxID=3088171 RepID=UPI0038D43E6C
RDIISATGNTLHPNNTIFVNGLYNCDYSEISEQFTNNGYYCYCVSNFTAKIKEVLSKTALKIELKPRQNRSLPIKNPD